MAELTPFLNENHRYFPEWADRPGLAGPLVEADHNSYLAGGYSEEFGYRVSIDRPPVFSPLEGDPDGSRLWYVHITGLHPGYPECARPDDRGRLRPETPTSPIPAGDSAVRPLRPVQPIHVIRVGERVRKTSRHDGLAARLGSFWARRRAARRELDH